jgi:hypothetical protein
MRDGRTLLVVVDLVCTEENKLVDNFARSVNDMLSTIDLECLAAFNIEHLSDIDEIESIDDLFNIMAMAARVKEPITLEDTVKTYARDGVTRVLKL